MRNGTTTDSRIVRYSATVLALVLVMAAAAPLSAQESIRMGGKLALNVGWFGGSDWNDQLDALDDDPNAENVSNETRIGVLGGGFIEITMHPNFALQPELLFANVGGAYSYDVTSTTVDVDGTIRATALKAPLLIKPKLPVSEDGELYALVGPTAIIILGEVHYTESGGGISVSSSQDPDNRFVLSATVGAGYAHAAGPGALQLEARYNRTLTDIFENDNSRINSLNMFMGYGFDL